MAASFSDIEYLRSVVKDPNRARLMSDAEVEEMEKAGRLPPTASKDGTKIRLYAINVSRSHEYYKTTRSSNCIRSICSIEIEPIDFNRPIDFLLTRRTPL